MNIIRDFQRLWIQVAFWMRAFFKSTLEESADLPAVTARLFRLPTDFYNLFLPYFGEEVAQQVYDIIYAFINTNYQLVNAYNNNDTAATIIRINGRSACFISTENKFWVIAYCERQFLLEIVKFS